jgi:hypothetical protein
MSKVIDCLPKVLELLNACDCNERISEVKTIIADSIDELQKENMAGIGRIVRERKRQIEKEGFTAEHDDQWETGELAKAAICYLIDNHSRLNDPLLLKTFKALWPFGQRWWKPTSKNRIRELEKAGALIAAEIDRLLRME